MPRKKRRKANKHLDLPSYHYEGGKIKFVIKNVILFGLLSILFYFFSTMNFHKLFADFFYLLFISSGLISFAFFIVLLILITVKMMKK